MELLVKERNTLVSDTDRQRSFHVLLNGQNPEKNRSKSYPVVGPSDAITDIAVIDEFFGMMAAGSIVRPPVDTVVEITTGRKSIENTNSVYLIDRRNPGKTSVLHNGRHEVHARKHIIVFDCAERVYLSPIDDCILNISPGIVDVAPVIKNRMRMAIGVRECRPATMLTSPDTGDILCSLSEICSLPGEMSVFRSHPLFRDRLPQIHVADRTSVKLQGPRPTPVIFRLPADLRFLYAAAPLAYYTGATIIHDNDPSLKLNGREFVLPPEPDRFEEMMSILLKRMFFADYAIRQKVSGLINNSGPGSSRKTVPHMADIMKNNPGERLLKCLPSSGETPYRSMPWHVVSYLDSLPHNVEAIPFLLRSLSSIWAPKKEFVSEREVVAISVRKFNKAYCGHVRGTSSEHAQIVYPALKNAMMHLWFSDYFPVDAVKVYSNAPPGRYKFSTGKKMPRIGIVCNEESMQSEARTIKDSVSGSADVHLHSDLTPDELLSFFSQGYDIVQFIGHCDHRGLKCAGGFADLANVPDNNSKIFFFNSCASYEQGAKLIEKGSVCGITTLFRVIEEAAIDVCTSFYDLLSRGYPLITSYLGARECSALGKEYLLMGDGFFSCFGNDQILPLYVLAKAPGGYDLKCIFAHLDRGLSVMSGSACLPDTGYERKAIKYNILCREYGDAKGVCIYNGRIYDSIIDAARNIR